MVKVTIRPVKVKDKDGTYVPVIKVEKQVASE